jgi:hypothetical protein
VSSYSTSEMLITNKGYNGRDEVNGIAGGDTIPGPTITSMLDHRITDPSRNLLGGYVIEDGCIPAPLSSTIQVMLILQTFWNKFPFASHYPASRLRKLLSALKSLVLGPHARGGAIRRTATYLVMSHDSNEGTLTIERNKVHLRLPAEGRSEHSRTIRHRVRELAAQSGAKIGHSYFFGMLPNLLSFLHV